MPRIGRSESRPARREAAALALALVAAAGFGTARLASARRICRPRLQVVGIPADVGTRPARCTDGDPFCDADGAADAKCDFRVRLCFDGGPGEECDPDDVKRMSIVPTRGLEALSASLDALKAAIVNAPRLSASFRRRYLHDDALGRDSVHHRKEQVVSERQQVRVKFLVGDLDVYQTCRRRAAIEPLLDRRGRSTSRLRGRRGRAWAPPANTDRRWTGRTARTSSRRGSLLMRRGPLTGNRHTGMIARGEAASGQYRGSGAAPRTRGARPVRPLRRASSAVLSPGRRPWRASRPGSAAALARLLVPRSSRLRRAPGPADPRARLAPLYNSGDGGGRRPHAERGDRRPGGHPRSPRRSRLTSSASRPAVHRVSLPVDLIGLLDWP